MKPLLMLVCWLAFLTSAHADKKVLVTFDSEGGPNDPFNTGFTYTLELKVNGEKIKVESAVNGGQSPENAAASLADDVKEALVTEGGLSEEEACDKVWQKGESMKVKGIDDAGVKGGKNKVNSTVYGKASGSLLGGTAATLTLSTEYFGLLTQDGSLDFEVGGVDSQGVEQNDAISMVIPAGLDEFQVSDLVETLMFLDGWNLYAVNVGEFVIISSPSLTEFNWVQPHTDGEPNFVGVAAPNP